MAKRIIIIGAGEAGRMILREIGLHAKGELDVVGFLDDNPKLVGQQVESYPVLGSTDRLVEVAAGANVDEVLIAVPSGGREFVRRVVRLCRDAGVAFRIVPGLIEIIRGDVDLGQIRPVHPEDLLGRETVEFDEHMIREELAGRRVMVTGAGGSIGAEICRQVGQFELEELQLLGRGENQIYDIEEDLRARYPGVRIRSIIGDIRDRSGLAGVFQRFEPEFVYHAAAHKHVHYMEAYPEEAVKNNVIGTANIIDACKTANVARLVMLSTDKAVRPRGIMGATKRIAEYLMVSGDEASNNLRLMTVRFGNVLGSRGSVVPLFVRQIQRGGPVTVSDAEATRFFMTVKEACMLVVQASIMGRGGEIFVLRMGPPIKILEMARDLIALHGLRPDIDIPIRITGLRAGEKLTEDLIADGEKVAESSHPYILISHPVLPEAWDAQALLQNLRDRASRGDGNGIRKILSRTIPDASLNDQGSHTPLS